MIWIIQHYLYNLLDVSTDTVMLAIDFHVYLSFNTFGGRNIKGVHKSQSGNQLKHIEQ